MDDEPQYDMLSEGYFVILPAYNHPYFFTDLINGRICTHEGKFAHKTKNKMHTPRLESKRLILQSMKANDATAFFAYHAHPTVAKYQSLNIKNESDALRFIKGHDGFDFGIPDTWYQIGIYLKSTHTLIGDIGIHFLHAKTKAVEIGYTIAPKHQSNGYAFEAVSRMIEFLFTDFGASMVIAVTVHKNHPSIGLLARLNFENASLEHLPFSLELLPEEVSYALSKTRWDSVT